MLCHCEAFCRSTAKCWEWYQNIGKVITGIGLVGDAAALLFPPAEVATGGFTALGAGINGIGNAISGAGGVLILQQQATINGQV